MGVAVEIPFLAGEAARAAVAAVRAAARKRLFALSTVVCKNKGLPRGVLYLAYTTTVVLEAQNNYPPRGVLKFCTTRYRK